MMVLVDVLTPTPPPPRPSAHGAVKEKRPLVDTKGRPWTFLFTGVPPFLVLQATLWFDPFPLTGGGAVGIFTFHPFIFWAPLSLVKAVCLFPEQACVHRIGRWQNSVVMEGNWLFWTLIFPYFYIRGLFD